MSKKSFRDLKNEIIELKDVLSSKNGRIAVLCLSVVQKEEKIQEYKGMIKSLEHKLSTVSDVVNERKVFKIPLRTAHRYEKVNRKCSCGKDATIKYYGKYWCDDCFNDIV